MNAGPRELNEILEIRKAFEANDGVSDIADLVDGGALSMQYIDETLASIVSSDADFAFLKSIPRRDVTSTLPEFTRNKSHGENRRRTSFVGQSADPNFADAYLKREYDQMSFLSEGFKFNRVVQRVKNIQDPETVQSTAAMYRMLESLASAFWHGDRTISPLEFDGLAKRIPAENIVDMEGNLPEADLLAHWAGEVRSKYYGRINKFVMPVGTMNLFDARFRNSGAQYNVINGNDGNKVYENNKVMGTMASQALNGQILYESDLWIDESQEGVPQDYNRATDTLTEQAIGEDPPDAPTVAVSANAPTVSGSKWTAAYAGLIKYRVAAEGPGGVSVAAAEQSDTVAAAGSLDVTITPAGGGGTAEAFVIYRETAVGSGVFRKIARVNRVSPGNTVFVDLNETIPGTGVAVLGDFNSVSGVGEKRTIVLSELLKPLKTIFPTGVGGLRQNVGMLEWYITLQIFAEEKFVLFKNVPVE